jgi:hypothetical protein
MQKLKINKIETGTLWAADKKIPEGKIEKKLNSVYIECRKRIVRSTFAPDFLMGARQQLSMNFQLLTIMMTFWK